MILSIIKWFAIITNVMVVIASVILLASKQKGDKAVLTLVALIIAWVVSIMALWRM